MTINTLWYVSGFELRRSTSGESKKDFIHKIKIVLKELRETFICLKIINKAKLYKLEWKIEKSLKENNELISIFIKSAETAQKNFANESN